MTDTVVTTFDIVGKAEDVSDLISNITPSDTPFLSSIKTEQMDAVLYQWQEDTLRDPAQNKNVQGFDAVATARNATTLRSNVSQILQDTFKIARTTNRVKKYGRAKEVAYQAMKMGKELKKDLEYAYVGASQNASAGNSSTEAVMGNAFGTDGTNAIIASAATLSNSSLARTFTEDLLLQIHQTIYGFGADPSVLMINPSDSLIIADFAGATGRVREVTGDSRKIVNVVNVYVSPFGTLKVVMNRVMKDGEALLYDPSMWKQLVLDNWQRVRLAKVGDSEKHMMVGEFSLKHANYKATGRITDLDGS